MFNVIRIWFVKVAKKKKTVELRSIFGRLSVFVGLHLGIFQMPQADITIFSADGRTMSCSMDYSTTVSTERIGNRRRKMYNLARWTQNWWSDERKNDIGQENGWWTADCRPKNPIFASKIIVRWSFLEMELGFKWYIPTIISLQFERFSI